MVYFNRAIIALHLVALTSSFTPVIKDVRTLSSLKQQQRTTRTQTRTTRIDSPDDIELDAIVESTMLRNDPLPIEADQGKEIFLASLETTTPEDIAVDMQQETVATEKKTASDNLMDAPANNLGGGNTSIIGGPLTDDERTSVISVLAASQEAAIAAEAAMPRELKKRFEFANGTALVSSPVIIDQIPEIKPASEIVGEPVTAPKMETPSVGRILKFAIPAVGVWLCSPLLSLIDTSAVGLLAGTTQQAALNPAVAVTDYAALLIVSCITTLSVVLWETEAQYASIWKLTLCRLFFRDSHFISGLHVHWYYQPSRCGAGIRPRCQRKTNYDKDHDWCNATFDVRWVRPRHNPFCFCSSFVNGNRRERKY